MSKAARLTAITLGAALLTLTTRSAAASRIRPPQVLNNYDGMRSMAAGKSLNDPVAVGVGAASPTDPAAGGAPTFGDATGTGFHTGDAAHSGGQGSGLMGFHGTGALGTSAAISDMHHAERPAQERPPVGPARAVIGGQARRPPPQHRPATHAAGRPSPAAA